MKQSYLYVFLPENAAEFPFSEYDYILDAVDTVSAKLSLAVQAQAAGVPIISAMGAGNKLDGSRFRISDISETRVCPLARVMRRELKKRGVRRLKRGSRGELVFCCGCGAGSELSQSDH